MTGSAASLIGNARDNILLGTGGKNTLNGGSGNDKLYGKGGKDLVIGGSGKDKFVFDSKFSKSSMDTIKDFKSAHDDLWLENSLFKSSKSLYAKIKKGTEKKPAKLSKSFFKVGDKAKDKDDFLVYNKKTGILYYDKDGSGSAGMTEIAKFSNKTTLKYSDLLFI
ncbi:M10 family metallopeptidase C-terminal domain-containing protein [Microvirga roseola]|uniref:M10 family metallopeptidase C-terminal domain-containing protein n=1 Tax=Microvirga roseola TaxID=2883126 RepID=UPI001E51CED2|nr:calcium-binding protein [Microvirga roseola]